MIFKLYFLLFQFYDNDYIYSGGMKFFTHERVIWFVISDLSKHVNHYISCQANQKKTEIVVSSCWLFLPYSGTQWFCLFSVSADPVNPCINQSVLSHIHPNLLLPSVNNNNNNNNKMFCGRSYIYKSKILQSSMSNPLYQYLHLLDIHHALLNYLGLSTKKEYSTNAIKDCEKTET